MFPKYFFSYGGIGGLFYYILYEEFTFVVQTVKESDMWSCDLQSLNPIRITISIKKPQMDSKSNFGISKLKIWNFNKNEGVSEECFLSDFSVDVLSNCLIYLFRIFL